MKWYFIFPYVFLKVSHEKRRQKQPETFPDSDMLLSSMCLVLLSGNSICIVLLGFVEIFFFPSIRQKTLKSALDNHKVVEKSVGASPKLAPNLMEEMHKNNLQQNRLPCF